MSIEKERELFLKWHYNTFLLENPNIDINNAQYIYDYSHTHEMVHNIRENNFAVWLASANRQGYKLVHVEMSWQKADELASKEWDKNKSMFCVDNRDMSALQVEEFRLRWCKNKAYQIMSDYKAMIGAIE